MMTMRDRIMTVLVDTVVLLTLVSVLAVAWHMLLPVGLHWLTEGQKAMLAVTLAVVGWIVLMLWDSFFPKKGW